MQFEISREALIKPLQLVTGVVERRQTLPVLSNVLLALDNKRLSLTGTIVVARDLAHSAILKKIEAGEPMPDYFKDHIVYYAGPAKRPEGYASGSFGPTTAGRMDSYVEKFQSMGGSMVMLAKGNRSKQVTERSKLRIFRPSSWSTTRAMTFSATSSRQR